mgnify:CR=1 FL=1
MAEMKEATQAKLDKIDEQMKQLKARKKAILARVSQEQRKARTRKLIQLGGVVAKYFNREINDADIEKLDQFLKSQEERGEYFMKAMKIQ